MDNMKLYGNREKEAERRINTVRIFLKYIDIEFGINKCAHLTMKTEKFVSVGWMELSSGEVIAELESDKG